MRRIAVVTPILPIPSDKTRGRFIYETASALSKQATVRVFLQQAEYPAMGFGALKSNNKAVGSDFVLEGLDVRANTYPAIPFLSRMVNGWTCGKTLLPQLRVFQPDLVIGYWVYPEGAGALHAARQLKCPVVIGALGTDIHVRSGLNARMTRKTLQSADAVITVSEAMTRYTADRYNVPRERITTIVNGFNTSIFRPRPRGPLRAAHGWDDTHKVIVYVGRLIEAKGLRELLDAFGLVAAQDPSVRLVLIGEGEMRVELRDKIATRQLGDKVILTGGLLPDQVAEWLSNAELLALPSWSEGYPNVLVEALACGCPVLATTVGGIPEIVTEYTNGILVPPRDTPSLKAGVERALKFEWNRVGISDSMSRTWDDVARETLAVCQQVLAGTGAKQVTH